MVRSYKLAFTLFYLLSPAIPTPIFWLHGFFQDARPLQTSSPRSFNSAHPASPGMRQPLFWQDTALVLLITSLPPLHCPARGGVKVLVVVQEESGGWGVHLSPPRAAHNRTPLLNLHSSLWCVDVRSCARMCLLTLTLRGCRTQQRRIHGRNTDSHKHTHTHPGPVTVAQHLTHLDSSPALMPHSGSMSSLIKCNYSRSRPMNQWFLAQDAN